MVMNKYCAVFLLACLGLFWVRGSDVDCALACPLCAASADVATALSLADNCCATAAVEPAVLLVSTSCCDADAESPLTTTVTPCGIDGSGCNICHVVAQHALSHGDSAVMVSALRAAIPKESNTTDAFESFRAAAHSATTGFGNLFPAYPSADHSAERHASINNWKTVCLRL
jgi:hypothetical protein